MKRQDIVKQELQRAERSISWLAKNIGMSRQALTNHLNNKNKELRYDIYLKCMSFLNAAGEIQRLQNEIRTKDEVIKQLKEVIQQLK